ncbi:MAG: hypothetical protein Q9169_003063 [Polycauliona sp. 2 TL-2023]
MAITIPVILHGPTVTLPFRLRTRHRKELGNLVQRVSLQGLDDQCNTPSDFYKPCIRSPPKNNRLQNIRQPPVVLELVDTVTIWNGLDLEDCETLQFIRGHLEVCLEQLLQPQLIQIRACILENCADASFKHTSIPRRCRFEKARLMRAMLEALDAVAHDQGGEQGTSFRQLLLLYLWSLDCLHDDPKPDTEFAAIDIRFQSHESPEASFPALDQAQVISSPGYISFEGLDILPREGSSMVIKPHYLPNVSQELGGPLLHVDYCIESNHPWIHWDPCTRAFTGLVPRFSQSSDVQQDFGQVWRFNGHKTYPFIHFLKIDIKAVVIVGYTSSKVRLTRTTRMRITLRVLPPRAPPDPVALTFPGSCTGLRDQMDHKSQMTSGTHCSRAKDIESGYHSATAKSDPPRYLSRAVGFLDLKPKKPSSDQSQDGSSANESHRSQTTGRSKSPVDHSEKFSQEAEDLDTQYTPRCWQKRNDPYRWLNASVSPKTLKTQAHSATTPKTEVANTSNSDDNEDDVNNHITVPGQPTSTQQSKQVSALHTTEEYVAPLKDLEFSNKFSLLQDLEDGSSPASTIDNEAPYLTPPTSELEYALCKSDPPCTEVLRSISGRYRSETESTGTNTASAASVPLPPSPVKSDDYQEGGFSRSTRREYNRLKRVIVSEEATEVIEAFRQPGLSHVEKRQLLEALQMSFGRGVGRTSSLTKPAEEESDGDMGNDEWDSQDSDGESDHDLQGSML